MSPATASRRRCWHALVRSFAFIVTMLALMLLSDAQQKQSAPTGHVRADEDEIKQEIAKYAISVDEADTALASQVWLDSPEVSFIHPLGHEHGFEQIKENVYRHWMGDTFSERKLSLHDVSVHVYGDGAWAEFYWDFAARVRKSGSAIVTHGRETQVYWKTKEGWRLVHVHYSGMPPTKPARAPEAP